MTGEPSEPIASAEHALEACRDQFAFYAREHEAAGKHEKAETNRRFSHIAGDALARHRLSAAKPEWRDIASAPKDGAQFLGGSFAVDRDGDSPRWRPAVMWWDDKHHSDGWDDAVDDVAYVGAWMAGKVGSFGYEEYAEEYPTHWQPLPSAPGTPPTSEREGDWVLVPRVPTEAMLRAVDAFDDDKYVARGRAIEAWSAMLAAGGANHG